MAANIKKFTMENHPLRIGIMVDSVLTNKHVYEFIEWSNKQKKLDISHVIINNSPLKIKKFSGAFDKYFYTKICYVFFKTIKYIEKILLKIKNKNKYKYSYDTFNINSIINNNILIHPVTLNNHDYTINDTEILQIKSLNIDIIINYCKQEFIGDILNSARLGIISIEYANDPHKSGLFPGFWEVYSQQDVTEFSINHLTGSTNKKNTLIRGNLRTQIFFLLNQTALYEKAHCYLRLLIIRIADKGHLAPYSASLPKSSFIYGTPKPHHIINYACKLSYRLFTKAMYRLLGYQRQWNVAFVRDNWRNALLNQGISLKNPPNHFLADPFIISRSGKDYCFVEDYDYSTERGCIVVYQLNEKTAKYLGIAIEEPFHMSFPYLFEFEKNLYMCPETAEKKEIRLYKCLDFPCQWAVECILMKEVSAVDTLIFEKNDKWWMLTNIDYTNTGDYGQSLSIFYADSPLSSDWTPHPENPIYIDAILARNAGLLTEGDKIFRVAQAQGFDVYGKKTSILEITNINEVNFTESYVTEINPVFKKNILGTHHFYSNGHITVFDYLDHAFIRKP